MTEQVRGMIQQARAVIAALYVAPAPGQTADGEPAVTDPMGVLLKDLLDRARERAVVVALGSPYLARDFPEIESYLCTFSDATVSERSAARALFGEMAIRGRLPVSIPGVASRGGGIDKAAVP